MSCSRSRDICVNPLTWTTDTVLAGHEANLGSVTFGALGDIEPGVADAMCQNGQLIVSEVRSQLRLHALWRRQLPHIRLQFLHESASERAGARRYLFSQSGGASRKHPELIAERHQSLGLPRTSAALG